MAWGEWATWKVLNALTANPAVWAKTALFVTYDENGGFFDDVPRRWPGARAAANSGTAPDTSPARRKVEPARERAEQQG